MPPRTPQPLCVARLAAALTLAALTPSCAYMQTHKNVKELGRSFPGYQLPKPTQLYRSGSTWYVAAQPATFRQSHDVVHDNVFRQSHEPQMTLESLTPGSPAFHAISPHTAAILLREDGYVEQKSLAREIEQSATPWLPSLSHATARPVKAHIAGDKLVAITGNPTPAEIPFGYQLLSGLDFALVDVPGTVVYNVAVPFVAPFVFFYEFLGD